MDINRYIPRRIVHSVVTAMLLGLIMGHLGFSQSCISASSSIYPWHKCAAGRPADTHRFRWRHHSEHDAILHRTLGFRGGSSPPPPFPSKVSQKWSANIQGNPSSTSKPVRYPIVHDITEDQSKSKWLGTSTRDSKNRNIFDTKQAIDAFLTRDSRNSFISRVYAILTGQLIATVISILTFSANRNWAVWLLTEGKLISYLCLGLSMYAWVRMVRSEDARRESPSKWRLLALFTIGEAVSVGSISALYAFKSVVSAMMATAAATGAVTLYTLFQPNPKYDLSQWGAGLSSCGMIFLAYGVFRILELSGIVPIGFMPYSEALYSAIGACLFSLYLAYHTRLIVSGKYTKYQMNERDYVYGSMCLYLDIVDIFLFLLRMLGEDSDRK